jgi:hypothetical protein
MADEQYRWLDRETAELLLRGESLETVDAAARDEAERLAKSLGELRPPPSSAELPGEAAALAAFRAARGTAGDSSRADQAATGRHPRARDSEDGLVRIAASAPAARRPRWGRPARYGLTAALAGGLLGGVAFAATTGMLPTPFHRDEPRPGVSVSAAVTPGPLVSPTPNGVPGEPTPDGSTSGSTAPGTPSGQAGDGTSARPGSDADHRAGGWWSEASATCRDLRNGRQLNPERKQALESAAGSSRPGRVRKYCKNVLADAEGAARDGEGKGRDQDGRGRGSSGGRGDQNGHGGDHGGQGGGGDDDGHHIAPGGTGGTGGTVQPSSTPAPLRPEGLPTPLSPSTPSPTPTYSAL